MKNHTTFGIDLAKNTIQIAELRNGKVKSNKSVSPIVFKKMIITQKPMNLVFEACGGAHYWARLCNQHNHQATILPTQFVAGSRQGQKTDGNDAIACAVASHHPKAQPVTIKTEIQQAMQVVERTQQALTKQSTALNNMLIGQLFEFGIKISKRSGELARRIPDILEDAENGLPDCLRQALFLSFEHYQDTRRRLAQIEAQLKRLVRENEACRSLLALEGVGPVNALGLYLAIGDGHAFKNGRAAAACIGVTPKQHSTGGKVKLGTVGKNRGNRRLRYTLFQGAMSIVKQLEKRPPRTEKEQWFFELIARRGVRCAAMAYANKTVRTAWALLRHNTAYQAVTLEA